EHLRSWLIKQSRIHGFWQLRDDRIGRTTANQMPLHNWPHYDNVINRWFVANEMDARITEARHVDPVDNPREMLRFINELVATEENRGYRLTTYNLLDLVLTEISENLS